MSAWLVLASVFLLWAYVRYVATRQLQMFRELAEALEKLAIVLIYHDATVRGKNPETLGSTEELLRVLKGKTDA